MIKYGMDSLQDATSDPKKVLDIINRIVEKSVDDDMFISMFYGRYNVEQSIFTYASAGHDLPFFTMLKKGSSLNFMQKVFSGCCTECYV